jgi:hypothetical protein
MSYPHSTVFVPTKLLGDIAVVPGGFSLDLNSTVAGQPLEAFSLPSPRCVVLTNRSSADFVDVAFYAAGSTVTPSYGGGIAIPPGAQVGFTLPQPLHTRLGAVTAAGKTVALNVVCGHGV